MILIRSALSAVSLRKRQLKLGINRYTGVLPNDVDITSLIEPMTDLIVILHSKHNDWSLILFGIKVKGTAKNAQLQEAIARLNEVDGYNAIMNLREDSQKDIVVRGNEMSGIRAPWIMHCDECSLFGSVFQ